MMTRLPIALLAGALLLPVAASPMPDEKGGKTAGADRMFSSEQMGNMPAAEKAAMFDRMSSADRMAMIEKCGLTTRQWRSTRCA